MLPTRPHDHNGRARSVSIWRVTFSTRFPSLTKASWHRWGEGQGAETNSVYPGNCSCYCKWPREPISSGCARLCVPGVPVTWRLASPLAPHCSGPGIATATGWSRTAKQGGRGGTRGATRDVGSRHVPECPRPRSRDPLALAKRRAPLCATAERGHSAQLEPRNSVTLNPGRGGQAVAAHWREDRGSLRLSPHPPTSNTPAAVLPWCTGFPVRSGKGGQLQREGRRKGYCHSTPRGSFPEAAWFLLRTAPGKTRAGFAKCRTIFKSGRLGCSLKLLMSPSPDTDRETALER